MIDATVVVGSPAGRLAVLESERPAAADDGSTAAGRVVVVDLGSPALAAHTVLTRPSAGAPDGAVGPPLLAGAIDDRGDLLVLSTFFDGSELCPPLAVHSCEGNADCCTRVTGWYAPAGGAFGSQQPVGIRSTNTTGILASMNSLGTSLVAMSTSLDGNGDTTRPNLAFAPPGGRFYPAQRFASSGDQLLDGLLTDSGHAFLLWREPVAESYVPSPDELAPGVPEPNATADARVLEAGGSSLGPLAAGTVVIDLPQLDRAAVATSATGGRVGLFAQGGVMLASVQAPGRHFGRAERLEASGGIPRQLGPVALAGRFGVLGWIDGGERFGWEREYLNGRHGRASLVGAHVESEVVDIDPAGRALLAWTQDGSPGAVTVRLCPVRGACRQWQVAIPTADPVRVLAARFSRSGVEQVVFGDERTNDVYVSASGPGG